jgi:glycine/D-amino acid oxidase-like deaminating enzyme
MHRRQFLGRAGIAAAALSSPSLLAAQAARTSAPAAVPASATPPLGGQVFAPPPPLVPIKASTDRIVAISVCTRPFRARGPRTEREQIGRKTVVHNYGHGGSGWSLSWGTAEHALRLIEDTEERELAIIGCGAIGLTTALVAQRQGYRVRIHAAERMPDVRSFLATGAWTPESRICSAEHATPEFERRWADMARISHRRYQTMLGLPGDPIEWRDQYILSDVPFDQPLPGAEAGEPEYPVLESRLTPELHHRSQPIAQSAHPFPVPYAKRVTNMVFNISTYSRMLMDEFLQLGGELHTRHFESPRQFADLREKTIINCTGYGARALLGDESVVPVRGQTARLIPQPEVNYGLYWRGHNLSVVPRRDGILVQAQGEHDFGNDDIAPDAELTYNAIAQLAKLFPSLA